VQFGAGVRIHRRPGETVAAGERLFTLYTDSPERLAGAMAELDGGWSVGSTPFTQKPLIIDRITP
jgi:thymidine phosphorylase